MSYSCNHGSVVDVENLDFLPDFQGYPGRHFCATCASAWGQAGRWKDSVHWIECPHGESAPLQLLNHLEQAQGGPGRHKCVTCAYAWGATIRGSTTSGHEPPEADGEDQELFVEGTLHHVELNIWERNRHARTAALKHHGTTCLVCCVPMNETYGTRGADVVQVHHLHTEGRDGTARPVDPRIDLVPVCPNCHVMLHRESPPLTPEALRAEMTASD
jgi:hypothetical protein